MGRYIFDGWPRSLIAVPTGIMNTAKRQEFNDPGHAHFLTFSIYRRCQIFTDDRAGKMLAEAMMNARERQDFALWGYVFMPEHVHLLIWPRREAYSVGEILRTIKGTFARAYLREMAGRHSPCLRRLAVATLSGAGHRVWQRGGGYDRNLFTPELIHRAIEYIEYNPVRRGLVDEPCEWKWSSARARAGYKEVPIQIDEVRWAWAVTD